VPADVHRPVELAPGLLYFAGFFDRAAQSSLVDEIRAVIARAPLFVPRMPRTGKPFTVRMTNCGRLGWGSDTERGYRYQPQHPETRDPWPAIPEAALRAWDVTGGYPHPPEACLVNFYAPEARMGLHQDRDEQDLRAPVLSISLGDTCLFRYGGESRSGGTRSIRLESGDVVVIGGASRLAFHGVDRIISGSSTLLGEPGRINLTLRRVDPP